MEDAEDRILSHLQTCLKHDREAMTALVKLKVPCNDRLARYLYGESRGFRGEPTEVGILSILNALTLGPLVLMTFENGVGGAFKRFRPGEKLPPPPPAPILVEEEDITKPQQSEFGPAFTASDRTETLLQRIADSLDRIEDRVMPEEL